MIIHPYPLTLRPLTEAEGGGWLPEAPDLPGCMADGPPPAAAAEAAQDAIACWLEAAVEDGRDIPAPGVCAA